MALRLYNLIIRGFVQPSLHSSILWSGRRWRIQQASAKGQRDLSYDGFVNSPITRSVETSLRGRTASKFLGVIMRSVFEGADSLILEALSLDAAKSLKQKSTCAALKDFPAFASGIDNLVSALFSQIESNWAGRIPSPMNWALRRQTEINPINISPEVLLERAIVILAERGLLPGWYNQLPIASGLIDEKSDKRAAVDLIRVAGSHAELIELKWESDTPAYAAFEILRYGLAFLFCRKMQEQFKYSAYPLMKVERISLRVLAPCEYYAYADLAFLQNAMGIAIERLFREQTHGALQGDFLFLSFPPQFRLPFGNGAEVAALRDLPVEAAPVTELLAAISHIQPAWSKSA